MKKPVLLLALSLAACAGGSSNPEVAAWEQRAAGITIIRDDWGIPHVYGKTDADVVFGVMYAQAEDDFNRIETNYLTSNGRTAEAEGEEALWRDLRMKLFIDPDSMKTKYESSPDWLKAHYSMIDSLPFLFTGILFGLVAGISPGPLLALVIAETLTHSRKEGILVVLSPILTDLPIVLVSVLLLAKFSHSHLILGTISLLGALFIGHLAYESIAVKAGGLILQKIEPHSLRKGVIANFLSPHPYLFWIAVGAPMALKAYKVNFLSACLFMLGFYLFLIGPKILVAFVIDKSRDFLKSRAYI